MATGRTQLKRNRSKAVLRLVSTDDNPGAPQPISDPALDEILDQIATAVVKIRTGRGIELQRNRDVAVFLDWCVREHIATNYLARRTRFPAVMRRIHRSIESYRREYGYRKKGAKPANA